MPSSEGAGIPEEWEGPRARAWDHFATVVLVIIAALSLSFGVILANAGRVAPLKYFLLFGLAMCLVVTFGLTMRYYRVGLSAAVRTVESNGVLGTEIRYSGWQFRILFLLMACFAVFCGAGAVEIAMDQSEGFPDGSLLPGALALLFASYLAAVASGRVQRGGIVMTSQGITQRGRSFVSRLEWSAVAGATPDFIGYPVITLFGYANDTWVRRYTARFWRIERLPPLRFMMLVLDCRWFDVDPRDLYRFVLTYVDNPTLRSELGTEAALVRARQTHSAT